MNEQHEVKKSKSKQNMFVPLFHCSKSAKISFNLSFLSHFFSRDSSFCCRSACARVFCSCPRSLAAPDLWAVILSLRSWTVTNSALSRFLLLQYLSFFFLPLDPGHRFIPVSSLSLCVLHRHALVPLCVTWVTLSSFLTCFCLKPHSVTSHLQMSQIFVRFIVLSAVKWAYQSCI